MHALLERRIDCGGLAFEFELLDIQQLNARFARGEFDIAKISFHAALMNADKTVVLPAGAAIGFGVGPVLLASHPISIDELKQRAQQSGEPVTVACPGELTTATLLCRTLLPFPIATRQMVFSQIMDQLRSGVCELGACIHEGRFTWQERGLHQVCDLGELWESQTAAPLPLGGLVARAELGLQTIHAITDAVRRSIQYAHANRAETVSTMQRYAQETAVEVLFEHVNLYVNRWTLDLGNEGRQALRALSQIAHAPELRIA
jgi:1,4-dihydroxy-6-naphthoate synthase